MLLACIVIDSLMGVSAQAYKAPSLIFLVIDESQGGSSQHSDVGEVAASIGSIADPHSPRESSQEAAMSNPEATSA